MFLQRLPFYFSIVLLLNHVELFPNLKNMKKNTNYALIKSTKHRQGSNFKHIYCISANNKYKEENLLPPFSFIEKVIRATRIL